MRFAAASVLALSMFASPAIAEVVAEQSVEQEIVERQADGSIRLKRVAADKVAPGEEIIYALRFSNTGVDDAGDLVMVMPVPREITYVEGSASGVEADVTFSADGGKTYLTRGRLTVYDNGRERAATGDEITHIRWRLNTALAPQAAGEVTYRGIVK